MSMSKLNKGLAAGLLILAAAFLAAAPALAKDPDEILKGLSGRYQGLAALEAQYRRVASTPGTDQLFKSGSSQTATGVLTWAKPDRLLLDQKTPQPETMVTDGRTVWWYIPSEKLVNLYKNLDVAGQLKPLITFLSGLDALSANFKISPAKPEKSRPDQHGLTLTPLVPHDGGLDKLVVFCDKNYNLTGFRLHGVTGETTDFFLERIAENPAVKDGIFKFKIPKGADVVENNGEERQ